MKAVVYEKYGAHEDVLELKEVNKPTPKDNEVLVKIHATGINFADYGLIRGKPYLEQFKPGDEVFGDIGGVGWGGFAEYVSVPENVLALKPADISFEEAAALPQATLVVVQGLRDHGRIQPGQKVLINGASGNNGSLAVQVAKSFGAEVTGVCSTKNLEFVKSLGADKVIDYTQEDFTKSGQRYD
ncbi:MAG: NAD(P)-dependent alcohol dehydrogenase, partial [Candidatus Heimdallarchaeaceae archaeon]